MVIPEHAEIADANGRHEGTNHLIELASRRTKNTPECRVAHIEEWFYRGLDRRIAYSLTFSLVRSSHRLELPLTSILALG